MTLPCVHSSLEIHKARLHGLGSILVCLRACTRVCVCLCVCVSNAQQGASQKSGERCLLSPPLLAACTSVLQRRCFSLQSCLSAGEVAPCRNAFVSLPCTYFNPRRQFHLAQYSARVREAAHSLFCLPAGASAVRPGSWDYVSVTTRHHRRMLTLK